MPAIRPESPPAATPPIPRRNFIARVGAFLAGGALIGRAARAADTPPVHTMDGDPYIGQIEMVGFNFAPVGWALCDGTLLSIAQNTALFSLLGTQYGGDGRTTFALPDLRGRVPIHQGAGPGLTPYTIGQFAGEENHTLNVNELPQHTHTLQASSANGTTDSPVSGVPARNGAGIPEFAAAPNAAMAPNAIAPAGGGLAHNNMQPYLCINFIIALQGIFPPRP
jgi:microcystin-dependent protein